MAAPGALFCEVPAHLDRVAFQPAARRAFLSSSGRRAARAALRFPHATNSDCCEIDGLFYALNAKTLLLLVLLAAQAVLVAQEALVLGSTSTGTNTSASAST